MLIVPQQVTLQIIKLALRIVETGKNTFLGSKFVKNEIQGRSNLLFRVPRSRLNVTSVGFIIQAIRLMNQLPLTLMEVKSQCRQKAILSWIYNNIQVRS